MKFPFLVVPIVLASAVFSTSARAQLFSPYQMSLTDSDVFNAGAGATALAFDFNDQFNGTTTVVNGVTFTGSLTNAATGVSFSYTNLPGSIQNGVQASGLAPGATANYAFILNGARYNNSATSTLALSGLTAGNTYQLQLFGGSTAVSYIDTFTDATTIPGPTPPSPTGTLPIGPAYSPSDNEFINETFTAPSNGTEVISLSDSTSYLILDTLNLQTTVPEPSTYAMMLGGIGFLALMRRIRAFSA